ncbi:unnamed protein product [Onchocerca flexuosa]|uniref:G_PROTEIN_RECEP_F1_2 domain-containing protein n=1 Tax=Onchocerca flexuosa TaxID=387005 RepID=A0A183HY01_9BILA|nr:unnamed protein product [Onchocerca flexuosa]
MAVMKWGEDLNPGIWEDLENNVLPYSTARSSDIFFYLAFTSNNLNPLFIVIVRRGYQWKKAENGKSINTMSTSECTSQIE